MNDSSEYQRAPEPDAPDFMQYAAMQLRQVITGIDARAMMIQETSPGQAAEWDAEVRQARLSVADRFIALAQIQYDIPDEDGDPEDDEDEPDMTPTEMSRRGRRAWDAEGRR